MSNVMEEMEKELAIISETARQITHKRFGVDLTRKQLHRISKALSRYQSENQESSTKTQDPITEALEEWSSAKEQHASTRTDEDYDAAEKRLSDAEAGLFTALDSLKSGEIVCVNGEELHTCPCCDFRGYVGKNFKSIQHRKEKTDG